MRLWPCPVLFIVHEPAPAALVHAASYAALPCTIPLRHHPSLGFLPASQPSPAQLAETLGEDVAKMWDSISKPPQYVGSKIEDFFEIQYAALPHYEEKYDDFVADSIVLRRRWA